MISTFLVIKAKRDLLSRIVANIVESLKKIETSDIYFRFLDRQVNAKSLAGFSLLRIKQNESFEAYIISKDDAAAAIDLEKLIRTIEPYCEVVLVD